MKAFSFLFLPFVFLSNFIALSVYSIYGVGAQFSYLKYAISFIFIPVFIYTLSKKHWLNQIAKDKVTHVALITIFAAVISFNNSRFDLGNFLQNIQFVIIIFVAYFTGWSLSKITNESISIIIKTSLFISVFAITFGFSEFFIGNLIWRQFSLAEYFGTVMGFQNPIDPLYGLPRSWISWDLYGITGNPFRRMVSFFVEPVGFGRFIAMNIIFLYYLYYRKTLTKITFFILTTIYIICLALNFSKGGFILLITFFTGWFIGVRFLILGVTSTSILLVALLVTGNAQTLGPSVANHLSSVVNIKQILDANPIGLGLSIDDVSLARKTIQNENQFVEEKSEGGLALYVILFGYLGLFIYYRFISIFYQFASNNNYDAEMKFFSIFAICILLTGIFAHSAFSLVGSGVPLIILGYINGKLLQRK